MQPYFKNALKKKKWYHEVCVIFQGFPDKIFVACWLKGQFYLWICSTNLCGVWKLICAFFHAQYHPKTFLGKCFLLVQLGKAKHYLQVLPSFISLRGPTEGLKGAYQYSLEAIYRDSYAYSTVHFCADNIKSRKLSCFLLLNTVSSVGLIGLERREENKIVHFPEV